MPRFFCQLSLWVGLLLTGLLTVGADTFRFYPSDFVGPPLPGSDPRWEEIQRFHQELAERKEADTQRVFTAILQRDYATLQEILAAGHDPDRPLPKPAPAEFLHALHEPRLVYYATKEDGFTPLMLAAGLGDINAARLLLEAGADRWKKTKRHRTYALWLASRTGDIELMRLLMNLDPEGAWQLFRIHVSLTDQRLVVFQEADIVLESPVSSGKKSKPTPPGRYVVTDKHRDWKSTIYNVSMPHFVRLSCSEIGFHAGRLPGYPASSGCIRLPPAKARELFSLIPLGTLVDIE
jgi:hypothetical protein